MKLTILRGISGSGWVAFTPYVHDPDYLPNGEENRCVARTRKGKQCMNPVLYGQIHYPLHSCDGVDACKVRQADYDKMLEAKCYVHA